MKGGLITSQAEADKNRLETATLSWGDSETGSNWHAKTKGGGFTIGTGQPGAPGSGPLINPTLKDGDKNNGSAKSVISPAWVIIHDPDRQQQDITTLNRIGDKTNDVIAALPDLQTKLAEQLKTQLEWAQAAENMAKTVKSIADYMRDNKAQSAPEKALWDDGGAARAALHAIGGGLLGGRERR